MLKPVEKPIKFVKNLETKGKSYPVTHVSAVIDDNGESVKSTIDSLKNKSSMTEVTWLELKDKRDAGKLIPGSLYRITDYQCTTTQENTRSAGHLFDIVLLALSKNKLAEEGWAMMNESNIYDVTFADGVTKKCWIYDNSINPLEKYNVVNVKTLKGFVFAEHVIQINEENKTASLIDGYDSDLLDEFDNLTYNYFQNSNLSAWKVWYCLDNDKSRFTWADDSMGESSKKESIKVYITAEDITPIGEYIVPAAKYQEGIDESIEIGGKTYYIWINNDEVIGALTLSRTPKEGDKIYYANGNEIGYVISYQPENLVYNGRGVIYRLIDEWDNDVAYDFKNIQFIRPLTDGMYDEDEGTNTWCYTTGETALDIDLSIWHYPAHDLYISSVVDIDREDDTPKYFLPNNVFLTPASSKLYDTTRCTMMGAPLEMRNCRNVILGEGVSVGVYINCSSMSDNNDKRASFYFNNVEIIPGTKVSEENPGDEQPGR